MKREIRDIIENDVVIPDIVLQAKEEAFAKIPNAAAPSEEKAEVALVKKTGRKFKKKWIAVAMVAVLAVGTLSAGAAAGGFDGALLKFMGIENIQPGDLPLNQKNLDYTFTSQGTDYLTNPEGEEKEVTIAITDVIGDNSTAVFRLDMDYEVPEDFNPETHWIIYSHSALHIYNDAEMTEEAPFPEDVHVRPYYEDGQLYLVARISGLDDINKKYFHWEIFDLMYVDREKNEFEVVYEGTWDMKFQLDYEAQEPIVLSTNITVPIKNAEFVDVDDVDGERDIRNIDIQITEITITPLDIRVEAVAPFDPTEEDDQHIMYSLDKLTFKGGKVEEYDYSQFGDRAYRYNAALQSYPQDNAIYGNNNITEMFGQGISLDELESITINGVDIKVK